VRKRRWFLPDTPDLIGQLRVQAGITLEGIEALTAWAGGDEGAGGSLMEIEHRGDVAKRDLLEELRDAFITPLAPEDLFALSRGLDWILDYAWDLVSESKAMSAPPDERLGAMAALLQDAVGHLADAVGHLGSSNEKANEAADLAITAERQLEHAYYRGMAQLLMVDTRNERISSRELYRRCTRIGEQVVDVAERIIYSVVKES
jgi:uncharacterized protein